MTLRALKASRALWRRREKFRYRKRRTYRLKADRARKAGKLGEEKTYNLRAEHWDGLYEDAKALRKRRDRQINAKKPMREKAADIMVGWAEDDVREKGGNNRGADVERIIRGNGGVPGEPWCGDAVAVAYLKAGSKTVQRAWASVNALARLLTRVVNPRRGHVVIYDFQDDGNNDHTALFLHWIDRTAGRFAAAEGNTKPGTAASDAGGGEGVYVRTDRYMHQVSSFRRVLR